MLQGPVWCSLEVVTRSMWFLGMGAEPELPTEEDEAARAEMENEESLMGEMNRQMVEAKLQLEAERARVQELEQRLERAETALATERDQWKQEYKLLEDQVGDLSRKNNDLSWSNQELLRMKRSDEAYEELQDTRAMMQALKDLAEDLYKKVALSKVMMIGERRRARLRVSLANWSLAAAGIERRHSLSVDCPKEDPESEATPSSATTSSSASTTEMEDHDGRSSSSSICSNAAKEERVDEGKQQEVVMGEEEEQEQQQPPTDAVVMMAPPPAATPDCSRSHHNHHHVSKVAVPTKPSLLEKHLLQIGRDIRAIIADVQESIRWREGLTKTSVVP